MHNVTILKDRGIYFFNPVKIRVQVAIETIHKLDEVKMEMSMAFILNLGWVDPRLAKADRSKPLALPEHLTHIEIFGKWFPKRPQFKKSKLTVPPVGITDCKAFVETKNTSEDPIKLPKSPFAFSYAMAPRHHSSIFKKILHNGRQSRNASRPAWRHQLFCKNEQYSAFAKWCPTSIWTTPSSTSSKND